MNRTLPGPVLTVSALMLRASNALVAEFGTVAVEGEVSSHHYHGGSGHMYWTLKDTASEVRCVMFRSDNQRLGFDLADGVHVIVIARPTIYQSRGQFQLQVTEVLPQGRGLLHLRFEALKNKLAAEGLFAAERKRSLPYWPRRIGIVTSAEGAALRDIATVIRRRAPATMVLLKAVPVQGAGAAPGIARAIRWFAVHRVADILIVGRGGGSLEDLWAFNEEAVVRAVAESPVPVVSAVGHETDTTLVDYAADLRAPTPSAAAERVVPETREIARAVNVSFHRLGRAVERRRLDRAENALTLIRRYGFRRVRTLRADARQAWGGAVVALPRAVSHQRQRRVAAALAPLTRYGFRRVADRRRRVADGWESAVQGLTPSMAGRMDDARLRLQESVAGLPAGAAVSLSAARNALAGGSRLNIVPARLQARVRTQHRHLAERLRAADPLAILARGYAVVTDADDRVITDAASVAAGDRLGIWLAHGRVTAEVTTTDTSDSHEEVP